uniref:Uncharacterized protein n=1 Tax=Macrostomum lignano TaxID=282301 RepID=A0A1I8F6S7_9PLAT
MQSWAGHQQTHNLRARRFGREFVHRSRRAGRAATLQQAAASSVSRPTVLGTRGLDRSCLTPERRLSGFCCGLRLDWESDPGFLCGLRWGSDLYLRDDLCAIKVFEKIHSSSLSQQQPDAGHRIASTMLSDRRESSRTCLTPMKWTQARREPRRQRSQEPQIASSQAAARAKQSRPKPKPNEGAEAASRNQSQTTASTKPMPARNRIENAKPSLPPTSESDGDQSSSSSRRRSSRRKQPTSSDGAAAVAPGQSPNSAGRPARVSRSRTKALRLDAQFNRTAFARVSSPTSWNTSRRNRSNKDCSDIQRFARRLTSSRNCGIVRDASFHGQLADASGKTRLLPAGHQSGESLSNKLRISITDGRQSNLVRLNACQ